MENIDYIIVGGGYAGLFFAHQLIKNNKTFVLFHNMQESASHVSAGVCNPVILKRFSTFWNSDKQMDFLPIVFSEIEAYTQKNYLMHEPVVRVFHNESEKIQWLKNGQKESLQQYLDPDFIKLNSVINNYDAGLVKHSCRIDVKAFFTDFLSYLRDNSLLVEEDFDFKKLNTTLSHYQDFSFKNIVFCEGINVNHNPYFSFLPVVSNKGHFVEIQTDDVEPESYIIKKKHFFISQGQNKFYCGGTYDRDDKSFELNQDSVNELKKGIEEIYKGDYKISDVKVGFRATVGDRKPILGPHKKINNMYVLNGLGARGVLNGSFFSKQLFDYIENKQSLDKEVDISRFYDLDIT